jgi:hypothetical protein
MDGPTRRRFLIAGTTTSAFGVTGCLRLTQDDGGGTSTAASTETNADPATTTRPTETNADPATTTRPTESATRTAEPDLTAVSDWQTTTENDADATVNSTSNLDFRVYKCATAFATRRYEAPTRDATVSFDYEVQAEQYWEAPYVVILDGGSPVYESETIGPGNTDFEVEPSGTTSDSFEQTVSVDGPFTVEVGLRPSNYCSGGDHANTYFRVKEFAVQRS